MWHTFAVSIATSWHEKPPVLPHRINLKIIKNVQERQPTINEFGKLKYDMLSCFGCNTNTAMTNEGPKHNWTLKKKVCPYIY